MQEEKNEFEKELEYYQFEHPELYCPAGNTINSVCTSSSCLNQAFFCGSDHCSNCSTFHEECRLIKFSGLTSLLQKRASHHKGFISEVFRIENEMIEEIRRSRRQIIQKYRLSDLEEKYKDLIDTIYRQKKIDMKGRDGYKLYMRLLEKMIDAKTSEANLLAIFRKKCDEILEDLKKNRKGLFKSYSENVRMREQNEHQTKEMKPEQPKYKKPIEKQEKGVKVTINQQIPKLPRQMLQKKQQKISNTIDLTPEDKAYIRGCFNPPPKNMKLLFTASEHKFKASKFHEKCDNIPHTFVLLKTEFGKILGGYTPNVWQSIPRCDVPDKTRTTFLVSITQKQKMELINQDFAICCSVKSGPIFGHGQDLLIADRCDQNQCIGIFPTNFNYRKLYTRSQESFRAFSGARQGYKFRIIEYEVYQIIF